MYVYIYIYIYINLLAAASDLGHRVRRLLQGGPDALLLELDLGGRGGQGVTVQTTANLLTKILDFGGLDSSTILISRGGTLMSTGNFAES